MSIKSRNKEITIMTTEKLFNILNMIMEKHMLEEENPETVDFPYHGAFNTPVLVYEYMEVANWLRNNNLWTIDKIEMLECITAAHIQEEYKTVVFTENEVNFEMNPRQYH